jgi:Ca2+/H+ antiporter
MKFLLFIFLITRTQQYYFDQFIQNETYMNENRLQELNKSSDRTSGRSMISNKILIIIIACLSIVVIAT